MSELKITVNNYEGSSFEVSQWNLRPRGEEPERVSVRRGNREYSIVLDNPIRVEVWLVDKKGELSHILETLSEGNMELYG